MGRTKAAQRRAYEATAKEKAATARAAAARRERRRRVLLVVGSSVAVLAVIGAIVAIGVLSKSSKPSSTGRVAASAAVVGALGTVPTPAIDAVGAGTISSTPKPISGAALTSDGKPEVLFIGAEFCPYCAAERWSLAEALSRFGRFTGLVTIHSSSTDVFPSTATLSFHGSTFTSSTVAFTPREVETVTGAALEQPTSAETALWHQYTGQGSFPFLDIAGRYVITSPSYDPGVLKGLTADAIAAQLADPSSKVAQAVDGAANVITAAICKATNGAPASVCSVAGVTAAASHLGG